MRYADLKKVGKGIRRFFHDDVTVVVVFLDHELLGKKMQAPELSVRGFVDSVGAHQTWASFRESMQMQGPSFDITLNPLPESR